MSNPREVKNAIAAAVQAGESQAVIDYGDGCRDVITWTLHPNGQPRRAVIQIWDAGERVGEAHINFTPDGIETLGESPPALIQALERDTYTVDYIADMIGVSAHTIRRAIKSGELHAVKIGRAFRCTRQQVDEYINARYKGLVSLPDPEPGEG